MSLAFPNPSRSFNNSSHGIEFWGYDNVFEVAFFVETGALRLLCPETDDTEDSFLQAFDTARNRIYDAAEHRYNKGHKHSKTYVLAENDF